MDKRIINCITCKHWVSQDTFGAYYNCELTPLRPESNVIRECENYEEKVNNIAQTQQVLDQMAESNKHLKSESNVIEIEEEIILSIYNANEALYYLKKELEKRQTILWTNKYGKHINIKDMDNTYLTNTIALLERQTELDEIQADYRNY